MKLEDFDYELPEELIAQIPLEKRDSSKLMILDKNNGKIITVINPITNRVFSFILTPSLFSIFLL